MFYINGGCKGEALYGYFGICWMVYAELRFYLNFLFISKISLASLLRTVSLLLWKSW